MKGPIRLPGYGVRWDSGTGVYRVANEQSGQWLRLPDGQPRGWRTFSEAWERWRVFERPSLVVDVR